MLCLAFFMVILDAQIVVLGLPSIEADLDMSAASWAEETQDGLVKGATGWGVRSLVRWLESGAPG